MENMQIINIQGSTVWNLGVYENVAGSNNFERNRAPFASTEGTIGSNHSRPFSRDSDFSRMFTLSY